MSAFAQVKVRDSSGAVVNPAQSEQTDLLRRIVKLLESSANIDQLGRQRVVIEAPAGTLGSSPPVSIASAQDIRALTMLGGLAGPASATTALIQTYALLQDNANLQFRLGIRSKLSW